MGLAGPRNRRKIQNDPNNTKWSRDETTFGQKILRAQGWEPGKFLGAQNSSHSHLHSAASAAPINVFLKDDTLGLGAKPKHKQNAECTGLDVFKDLLGRLNGKSEEVIEKEKELRSGIKTNLYVERKYGLMRFVSGGLLVGDQMNELTNTTTKAPTLKEEDEEKSAIKSEDATIPPTKKQKKEKSKKRKAENPDSIDSSDAIPEKKRKKRSKIEGSGDDSADIQEAEKSSKKKHKKSKRKENEETRLAGPEKEKKKKSKKSKKDSQDEAEDNGTSTVSEDAQLEKSLSKEERRAKKKEKKAKKQKQLETPDSSTEAAGSTDTSTPAPLITPQESGASTPIGTGASTSQGLSARHYARSRHIASKRMAMADMAALNQIFMVKPV